MMNLMAVFEPAHFVENLRYMGLGMLGIFLVIGVIALLTVILNAVTTDRSGSEHDKQG